MFSIKSRFGTFDLFSFRYQIGIFLCLLVIFPKHSTEQKPFLLKKSLQVVLNTDSPAFAAVEDLRKTWTPIVRKDFTIYNFREVSVGWEKNPDLWVTSLGESEAESYFKLSELKIKIKPDHRKRALRDNRTIAAEVNQMNSLESVSFELDGLDVHPQRIRVAKNLLASGELNLESNDLDRKIESVVSNQRKNVYDPPLQRIVNQNNITIAAPLASSPKIGEGDKVENREVEPERDKSYEVSGSVRLVDGLAVTDSINELIIYHIVNGEVSNDTIVDISKANYQLFVPSMFGYIVAELSNRKGEIVGYDEISMEDINFSKIDKNNSQIKLDIKLSPFKEGMNLKALSGSSFGDVSAPIKNNLNKKIETKVSVVGLDGVESIKNSEELKTYQFTKDSSLLISAKADDHWPTLLVGQGQMNKQLRLYKEKTVANIMSIYGQDHREAGVILGRVVDKKGKPVRGAKVELAGGGVVGPIYFSGFIPDKSISETNYDGLFSFLDVSPGLHALKIKIGKKELPTQFVVSEKKHVSYIESSVGSGVKRRLGAVDVFSKKRMDTLIKEYGYDRIVDIPKERGIRKKWSSKDGFMLVESDPGDGFEITRHLISGKMKNPNLPVVRSEWLKKILVQQRVNRSSHRSLLVGFVKGRNYEVHSGINFKPESFKVIYFDEKGRVVPKGNKRKNGGFIVIDTPLGVSSVSIVNTDNEKVHTNLIVSDGLLTNVIHANLP